MKTSIPFNLALLVLLALGACQHEPVPPVTPNILPTPRPLYSNPVPLSLANELPCDSIPQEDFFRFRDSAFIFSLAMNPHNEHQWAYTKVYPVQMDRPTYNASMSLHIIDLATGQKTLVDSFTQYNTSIRLNGWGGNYVVYDDYRSTYLYNVKTREKRSMHGVLSSISPGGEYILLHKFQGGNRIELINLAQMETAKTWKLNEMPTRVLWLNNITYIFNKYKEGFYVFNVLNDSVSAIFQSPINTGAPLCFLENEKRFLLQLGRLIDLTTSTIIDFKYEGSNCNNRRYKQFFNLKSQQKLLAVKEYRDMNHEWNEVLFYREFHIMNYDGSNEQRVELNFW